MMFNNFSSSNDKCVLTHYRCPPRDVSADSPISLHILTSNDGSSGILQVKIQSMSLEVCCDGSWFLLPVYWGTVKYVSGLQGTNKRCAKKRLPTMKVIYCNISDLHVKIIKIWDWRRTSEKLEKIQTYFVPECLLWGKGLGSIRRFSVIFNDQ